MMEHSAGATRSAWTAARRFPWKLFLALVAIAISAAAGLTFGIIQWLGRDLPPPSQLVAFQTPIKTTVYDARGRILHEFFKENRSLVPLQQIPRNLVNATLSTEDRNFYKHWGVDLWGVGRAVVTDVMHMRRAQCGSTITHQLDRNLFTIYDKSTTRNTK